jgi:hypothetical protein
MYTKFRGDEMKAKALKINAAGVVLTLLITRIIYKLTNFSYSFKGGVFNPDVMLDLGLCIIVFVGVTTLLEKVYDKKVNK